eukprot:Gb_22784 [translate_table: standard]
MKLRRLVQAMVSSWRMKPNVAACDGDTIKQKSFVGFIPAIEDHSTGGETVQVQRDARLPLRRGDVEGNGDPEGDPPCGVTQAVRELRAKHGRVAGHKAQTWAAFTAFGVGEECRHQDTQTV